jgi:glycosyltransferase EpsE
MEHNPEVSVLMAVYNGEPFVRGAIEGILNQTYRNFELLITDDCSTDRSLCIIEEYAGKDERIRIIKNSNNEGLTRSLINAVSEANGEYIARQDADDVSMPQRLEKQISFLKRNSEYGAVGTSAEIIGKEGSQRKNANVPKTWFMVRQILKFGNCFLHGSMMFRKEDYVKAGGYRKAFSLGQDYDLWLRISKAKKLKNLGEMLYRWRDTGDNISSMKTDPQFKIGALALYDYRFDVHLELDDDFEIDNHINGLNATERHRFDSCLRDLCLRHGNIEMAKKYINHGLINKTLVFLAAAAFGVLRAVKK